MKQPTDQDLLLSEVFAESVSPAFDDSLLRLTLDLAAERRKRRARRRSGALVVAAAAAAAALWLGFGAPLPSSWSAVTPGCTVIRTQPLAASERVSTHALPAGMLVATTSSVETVHTVGGRLRLLNDAELLAFFAGHPALLVREGPSSEKLVFASAADAARFQGN